MDPVIFEIIPPPKAWAKERVEGWVESIVKLLETTGINMLNIPEVVAEARENRPVPYREKVPVEEFAALIRKRCTTIEIMLNHITVIRPFEKFREWFDKRISEGYKYFVLVGGESSKIGYPGPSVFEAAEWAKSNYPDVKLGGITIFTRKNEAERIIRKMNAGIEFFVSQIIYETENMKQILFELEKKISINEFPFIYVSLAPVVRNRDIEFIKWLGVEFPTAVLSYFSMDETKLAEHSCEILWRIVDEINRLKERYGKERIGINFEHVMYNNLEISEVMLSQLIKGELSCTDIS